MLVKCAICRKNKQLNFCKEFPDTDNIGQLIHVCETCQNEADEFMSIDFSDQELGKTINAERVYNTRSD